MMDVREFRDLLDDRTAGVAEHDLADRMPVLRVRRRAVRARRGIAAGTLTSLVAASALVIAQPWGGGQVPVAGEGEASLSFAEYQSGGRLTVSEIIDDLTAPIEIVVEDYGSRLIWETACSSGSDPIAVEIELMLEGKFFYSESGPCATASGNAAFIPIDAASLAEFGRRPGDPLHFTVRVQSAGQPDDSPPRSTFTMAGSFGIAFYEFLGHGAYPYPPRPEHLKPIASLRPSDGADVGTLLSEPNPTSDPGSIQLVLGERWEVAMVSQTPGRLRLLIDGVEVHSADWWDYDQGIAAAELVGLAREAGLDAKLGQR